MKRLTLLIISGAVWLFLAAIPVFADGGPHVLTVNNGSAGITADSCAGCHRTHTSQSPTGMLLTDPSATITAYCRSCHGATGTGAATNVDNGVQYTDPGTRSSTAIIGALRSGGFITARIGSANGSRNLAEADAETKNAFIPVGGSNPVTSAHLAVPGNNLTATNILWGNGAQNSSVYGPVLGAAMQCTSCHNPHGNGNYRILDTLPVPGAAKTGTPVQPAVVVQALVSPSTRNPVGSVPRLYVGAWTAVPGMAVKDSAVVVGKQKNYTVIAKAPAGTKNYPAYPIPAQLPGAYLLYTDQITGYAANTGDYLKKFLTYDVDEAPTPGTPISNFYDGPNGHPNQGGYAADGARLTDFPENAPGTTTDGTKNYEGFGYQMTLWCTQCHTRYLGWNSSRSTNSGDATYMYRHSTSKYRVCSTCHVSHGSNAIMNVNPDIGGTTSANLPFPDGVVHNKSTVSGDSRLLKADNRGICLVCHDPTKAAVGQQGPPVTTAP